MKRTQTGALLQQLFLLLQWTLFVSVACHAQQSSSAFTLGSNCTATILNHSVRVNADGTFSIPNIPYNFGLYRAHILCTNSDGTTTGALSDFITLQPNASVGIARVFPGAVPPTAVSLQLRTGTSTLSTAGATTQITSIGILPDGSLEDESASPGTTYWSSNSTIATVSSTGLVTAVGAGLVTITVRFDGLVATTSLNVSALLDSDGDGMPDEWEIANGLNPHDPTDAGQDPDGDGLTNLQEYLHGTNPHVADTDGDGLSDGDEVKLGTNPLVADTDGDGLSDGQEVQLGTNPLVADTDGDGIPDGIEVKLGLNPLVPDPTTLATGHVIGSDGKPAAGASATIFGYFTGTTDGTGTFSIAYVPTDLSNLVAQVLYVAPGGNVYNGSSQPIAGVAKGTTDLGVIELGVSNGVVQGVVTSPSGKLVSGAQVTVAGGQVQLSAATDATGTYRVTNLPAGTVTVAVLDPQTGLRGSATGNLGSGPLTLNVALSGYGTVTGSVTQPDGHQAPAGVTVQLSGPTSLTTATNPLGQFTFAFVPVGSFTVQASDANGHQGSASGLVATTSQTVTANIQFVGAGTVSGLVEDKKGNPAASAQITLMSNSNVQQTLTAQADANGKYSISNVVAGKFTLSAAVPQSRQGYTQIGGAAQGTVQQDGENVTVNIVVDSAGSAAGIVYRSDGKTAAAGVKMSVKGTAIVANTDTTGAYEVDFVPPGTQQLNAVDPNSGDQGAVAVTVTANALAQAPAITLNGLGTAVVTVNDASGNTVPSAQVTLVSDTKFTQQLTGLTNSAGQYAFTNVLAGSVTVNASGPYNLAGTAQGTVPLNGSTDITVVLQPAGTIQGTVFAADGKSPVAGVNVQLDSAETTISDANGNYQFASVPSGEHLVQAVDGKGEPDSPVEKATITTQGQTVTANITMIGLGTVVGEVTNPDGSAAVGISVTLKSEEPGFASTFSAQTDTKGNYAINQVPVGTVALNALGSTGIATATTQLQAAGDTVTVNLQLNANFVSAAHNFYDANGFLYDIDSSGEIESGTNSVFAGFGIPFPGRDDDTLSLTFTDGTTIGFTGATVATTLQNGAEESIEQDNINGLNVIRRIFVPPTGYMARYIETLVNPSAAAITVDVNLNSGYRYTHESRDGYTYNGTPEVVASSSGDAAFSVTTNPATSDHWIIEGTDLDVDPFLDTNNVPAVTYVFDDGMSPLALTAGTFITTSNHGQMTASWGKVTVPAGQTVELMHFVSQQTIRAAALASARRLIQLPPEALAGLSASDAANIANFRVPVNLTSTLAALPPFTGSVSGQVIAGDGATPVPSALVSLQSTDPIYSRTYQLLSDGQGSFLFQSGVEDARGDTPAIPLEPANVSAMHPLSQVTSPVYSVALTADDPLAAQTIVFSNTGQIAGTVNLTPTEVVSSGTVAVSSPSLTGTPTVAINVDGSYQVTGLPAATYSVVATIAGTILTGNTTATVISGQSTTANILIGANGAIEGKVLGSDSNHTSLANVTVYLRTASGQSLSGVSGTDGSFAFNDLPPGAYTLQAYDPGTNTGATISATVTAGATVTQNIVLSAGANITGVITGPGGVSVSGLTTTLTVTSAGVQKTYTTKSDSSGSFSFSNVSLGGFFITVQGPQGYSGFAAGTLGVAGQTASVAITLTQAGTVNGTVYQSDGKTPAPGIQVQIYGQTQPYRQTLVATVITAANGTFSSSEVPVGGFTVVALNTATGDEGVVTGTIVTANQLVPVNVVLAGLGTLKIAVLNSNSQPDAGAAITVVGPFNVNYTATSDQQGLATISNVLAGNEQISATDPSTRLSATVQDTLAPGATQTVTLTLQASATLSGHVYSPDGSTPISGAILTIYGTGLLYGTNFTVTTAADGSYQFTGIPLGVYNLVALDSNRVLRAYTPGITLTSNGQLVTQNITFSGIGTVQGTVTNPDGTAAASIGVQVISASSLGGVFNTTTDTSGNYQTTGVPVGNFTVNAENLAQGIGGSATGSITSDGDIEIVNVQMVSDVIQLTQTLTDANGFKYDVQKDGTIGNGSSYYSGDGYFFGTADYRNAFHLALFTGGTENDFVGNTTGTGVTSLGGQQISIEQDDLAGLNVIRHVYVPSTGYFARYVESLTNPTGAPITVDLEVSGGIQNPGTGGTLLISTSSGDTTLSTADQWLVTDDDNGSTPWPLSQPSLAEAFAGAGASQKAAVASLTLPSSQNGYYYPQLEYRWNSITVAPGATVEIMHFAVQQSLQGQASAAVQRLVQQPPEIFAGLAASDAKEITNFAVNSNLISTLPALTIPSAGTVSGHVYGTDGSSPVPGAEVLFQGSDLFYGAGIAVADDSTGAFTIKNAPVGNFTVSAQEPMQLLVAPPASGKFASDATSATQDVIYSNAAVVKGTIVSPSETTYTGAIAYLVDGSNENVEVWQTNIGSQPNFTLPVVPPGTSASPAGSYAIVVQAIAPGNNGNSFSVTQPINPKAGDVVNLTFNLPDSGSLSGAFTNASGAAIAGAYVYIAPRGLSEIGYALTDSNGKFQFTELAVGTYTLTGTDPATGLIATASPVIKAGAATTQNLQIADGGTINLSVKLNGGAVAANSLVTINRSSDGGSYVDAGVTDSNGNLQITQVPVGNFTVIAYYPNSPIATGSVQGSGTGSIASNGQTVSLAITLPATSTLTGTVTSASGTPVSGASVSFYYQGSVQFDGYGSTTTNASGVYTFSPMVASQKIALTAERPNINFATQLTVTTAASGTLTQNITLPVDATLVVKAIDANGNPLPNQSVAAQGQGTNYYYADLTTQGDGTAAFVGVRDGAYSLILYNSSYVLAGSGTATVAATDDGKTVQATVQTGYTGTIQGTLLAADAVTPAPPGEYIITLTDNDSQTQVASVQSSDGTFSFPSVAVGRDGYSLTVNPPIFNGADEVPTVTETGKFTADGQTQTMNVVLAIPVITGTVYQGDGTTPAASPNVYGSVQVYDYSTDSYQAVVYEGISSANGTYTVPMPAPAPNASVVAEAGGLTSQAQVAVNTGDVIDKLDITLHASGTVTGVVLDQFGNPLGYNTTVSAQSSGSSYTLFGAVDPTSATFSIPYVATGKITVTATYVGYGCIGTATGTLANNGDTLNVSITLTTDPCTTASSRIKVPQMFRFPETIASNRETQPTPQRFRLQTGMFSRATGSGSGDVRNRGDKHSQPLEARPNFRRTAASYGLAHDLDIPALSSFLLLQGGQ